MIIFCNSVKTVDYLGSYIIDNDLDASYLHGQMAQDDRDSIMKEFRSGSSRILITTSIFARGVFIPNVDCIINF